MIPQVSDIFSTTRAIIGDTVVFGGQMYKDNLLQQYWGSAWNTLYRWLDRNNNKRLRRTQFYNVPANTNNVLPADMGINNLGRPEEIYDRTVGSTFTATVLTVNPASPGVPSFVDLTIPAHGLQVGSEVVAFAFGMTAGTISDDINSSWYIGVPDANTIRLNGCGAVDLGAAVGSTGIISTGVQQWGTRPLVQLFDVAYAPLSAAGQTLSPWKWENGAFRFTPSTTTRQAKIVYMLSGNAPQYGSVGLDDSLEALSTYLGGIATSAKGFPNKAASLFMRAVGNTSGDETNVVGGAFYAMAALSTQELNMTQIVVPRWRRKRNVGPLFYNY